jgi:hypothetical protein
MQILDYIKETKKVKWRELKDLQPHNLKVNYHADKTKKSLVDMGFAMTLSVWQDPNTQEIYICDGHTRKDLLLELQNEGYKIPEELSCTFLDNTKIKTKDRAIEYLLRVFNVKTNPMNSQVLEEWIDTCELDIAEEDWKALDIDNIDKEREEEKHDSNNQKQLDGIITISCNIVEVNDVRQIIKKALQDTSLEVVIK